MAFQSCVAKKKKKLGDIKIKNSFNQKTPIKTLKRQARVGKITCKTYPAIGPTSGIYKSVRKRQATSVSSDPTP